MKTLFTLLMVLVMSAHLSSIDLPPAVKFHSTVARDGDGTFILLRRYDLLSHNCNIEKFYELNNLGASDGLIKGRTYYLPIAIFNYNGVSIRSTIGANDWDKAVRIQGYNEEQVKKGHREEDYRKDNVLWVPYHELNCESEVSDPGKDTEKVTASVPDTKETRIVPLFGEGYEKIRINSDRLKGKVYYLVSGHGGPDPGAISTVGNTTLCEDEYAYDVTLRLARNLMEQGATVHVVIQDARDGIRDQQYLDCDHSETLMGNQKIPLNQLQRLAQRAEAINAQYRKHLNEGIRDQTVVCIHVDSRTPRHRQDVFFYYYGKSKSGRKIAYNLQKTFAEKYKMYRPGGNYHGTVSDRGLYMLRNTDPTAVYVELANIKNAEDRKRILPESNRQALANWLTEGLMRDL